MMKGRIYKLITRYIDKTINQEHIVLLQKWLIAEEHKEEKEEALSNVWNETDTKSNTSTYDSLAIVKTRLGIEKDQSRSTIFKHLANWRSVAASLLIITLGLTSYILSRPDTTSNLVMLECYVPAGEQHVLELPDGSRVQLNASTYLMYPQKFDGNTRQVYLSGEARFEVLTDKKKPFIVSAGTLNIEVLGTKFNIESYPGDENITTTLEEGAVKVSQKGSKENNIFLAPTDQLQYNNQTENFSLSQVNTEEFTAWTHKEVWFVDKPLYRILQTIERRYDIKFRYNLELDLDQVYSMKFKEYETIEDVMRIFALLVGDINYEITNKSVLLTSKGERRNK